jgi:hypothetical protein
MKDQGLYAPLLGGGGDNEESSSKPKKSAGRPDGTPSPQTTKKVTPIGENTSGSQKFSIEKIKENLALAEKLEAEIQEQLKLKYKNKRVTNKIRNIASQVCKIVIANESSDKWLEKAAGYVDNPVDANSEVLQEIQAIALEHQVDEYLASLLYASKI